MSFCWAIVKKLSTTSYIFFRYLQYLIIKLKVFLYFSSKRITINHSITNLTQNINEENIPFDIKHLFKGELGILGVSSIGEMPPAVIRNHQELSGTIGDHQEPSGNIRNHQEPVRNR